MAWAPTTDQILDCDGVHIRRDQFRFELCNRDLVPIGELHPATEPTPTIQNDTSNNTSRRLSNLRLSPSEAADVNVMSDRVRVYLVLQNGVEYRLGTFMWADANRPDRSWGQEQHSELVDFSFILSQPNTQAYGWGRGTTITLIMFFLFFRAGFELADIAHIGHEAARGLADPRAWQPGASWDQMLTDLGDLVGFASPYFDRDGRCYFDEPPDPAVDRPTVPEYDYGTRVIADSVLFTDALLAAPNDFAAFDSGTDKVRAGRYQLPPTAPHSFNQRGFRIGKVQQLQGTANQAQVKKAAYNLARRSDALEVLTFQSTIDPRHDTFDVVPAFGQNWLETSWSMELRPGGPMSHTCQRVSYDIK
jgi:hypothetical protein